MALRLGLVFVMVFVLLSPPLLLETQLVVAVDLPVELLVMVTALVLETALVLSTDLPVELPVLETSSVLETDLLVGLLMHQGLRWPSR